MNLQSYKVDINCDMGELDHIDDGTFIPFVSSCNISCGGHSDNYEKIKQTVFQAVKCNKNIGAHPSYPDLVNFGRVSMQMTHSDFKDSMQEQLDYLAKIVSLAGGTLSHVKAHGALYNDLANDENLSAIFIDIIKAFDRNLKIYGMPASKIERVATKLGMHFIPEVFMDRNYLGDLQLVPRSKANAMLIQPKEVLKHVNNLMQGKLVDVFGGVHPISWKTICIHSDTENALAILQEVSKYINETELN